MLQQRITKHVQLRRISVVPDAIAAVGPAVYDRDVVMPRAIVTAAFEAGNGESRVGVERGRCLIDERIDDD